MLSTSESCYRYLTKHQVENNEIANWLPRVTEDSSTRGLGICCLYLHNATGFQGNHKRVYRLHRELELYLHFKPRKRVIPATLEPLHVPQAINEVWSVDFMHNQ